MNDIFDDFDIMLFPIHLLRKFHWIVVRVDMINKTLIRIDSLNPIRTKKTSGNDDDIIGNMFKFLQDENLKQKGIPLNVDEWLIINSIPCPQQQNGYDCGVFAMMFMDVMIEQIPLNVITQSNMANYRIKIGLDLMRGKLRY